MSDVNVRYAVKIKFLK